MGNVNCGMGQEREAGLFDICILASDSSSSSSSNYGMQAVIEAVEDAWGKAEGAGYAVLLLGAAAA